jgi:hypothetical protein
LSARDYRLVVRIEIDRASLDRFTEKLTESIQKAFGKAMKNLPRVAGVAGRVSSVDERLIRSLDRLTNELAGLSGAISRLLRAGGRVRATRRREEREETEPAPILERLSRGSGPLAKAVVIGMAIYDLLKRLVETGLQYSGYLRATLKILETSVALFLKPIADFVGLLLRPFVLLMLPVAVALNRVLAPFLVKAAKGDWTATLTAILTTVAGYVIGRLAGQFIGKLVGALAGRLVGATIGRLIGGAVGSIFGPLGAIGGFILGGILGDLISDLFSEEGRQKIKETFDNFVQWVSDTFGGIGAKVGGAVTGFVEWIKENVGKIGSLIGDAWNGFVNWVTDNIGAIGELIGDAWDGFVKWITDNIGAIADLVGKAWESFVGWITDNIGKIADFIGKAWSDFVGWVVENFGKIASLLGKSWENFVNWIKDNIGKIAEIVGRGWESFVSFIQEMGRVIRETLKPVWDGIVAAFKWFWDKIRGIVDPAKGFAEWVWEGIKGFGEWISERLGRGRGQFGLDVRAPGPYFLEAGEMVLNRSDVMRLMSALTSSRGGGIQVTVNVTFAGNVYGFSDFERVVEDLLERRVGNILYDIQRRGIR